MKKRLPKKILAAFLAAMMVVTSVPFSAITAFAGVDPGVNESGTYEQKSVPTSKRGSSDLRKTLFQVMEA